MKSKVKSNSEQLIDDKVKRAYLRGLIVGVAVMAVEVVAQYWTIQSGHSFLWAVAGLAPIGSIAIVLGDPSEQ